VHDESLNSYSPEFGRSWARGRDEEIRETVERLRQRVHEVADEGNQRAAHLQSKCDRYDAIVERAREFTRQWRADWTTDPPSQTEYGWWRYTSQATTEIVIGLMGLLEEAEEKLDVMRSNISALGGGAT
jgi:hypothetical protein